MEPKDIVEEIKKAKKYSGLADEIINSEVEKYIKRNPKYENFKMKKILKEIKTSLHKAHGRFQVPKVNKRNQYLDDLKKNKSLSVIKKILSTNASTKERIEIYPEMYKKIFEITGIPRAVVDIGGGINGVSAPYMKIEDLEYDCYDINEKDSRFLDDFFNIYGINGKSHVMDCSNLNNLKEIPDSDVIFMLKFIDPVEKAYGTGHKLAEEIIKTLIEKTNYIIVSFATKTITGKMMNYPYRGWIERMLDRIGLKWKIIEFDSEFIYVIRRKGYVNPANKL